MERRAHENSVDFIEGVATAVTPFAVLETVMLRTETMTTTEQVPLDNGDEVRNFLCCLPSVI